MKRIAALLSSLVMLMFTPMAGAINGELEGALAWPGYTGAQFGGAYCPCETIQYPNLPFGFTFIQAGADALDVWLRTNPNPTYLIAHSEGAQAVDQFLSQHPNDPRLATTTIILTGNPDNKYNGMQSNGTTQTVPENTGYNIMVITRQYDGAADFPNDTSNMLAVLNAFAGMLFVHPDYTTVDLNNPGNVTWTSGGVTYVLTQTYPVPLLQPLAWLPPQILEPWDKAIRDAVEPAYTAAPRPAYPTYTTIPNTTTTTTLATTQEAVTSTTSAPAQSAQPDPTGYQSVATNAAKPSAPTSHTARTTKPSTVAKPPTSINRSATPPKASADAKSQSDSRSTADQCQGSCGPKHHELPKPPHPHPSDSQPQESA